MPPHAALTRTEPLTILAAPAEPVTSAGDAQLVIAARSTSD
ncbi:hypothetical protein [Micromonospora sp. ALFpr18c]|nr:hypothetical protein [Micromonospora sp. ALFpr18c]